MCTPFLLYLRFCSPLYRLSVFPLFLPYLRVCAVSGSRGMRYTPGCRIRTRHIGKEVSGNRQLLASFESFEMIKTDLESEKSREYEHTEKQHPCIIKITRDSISKISQNLRPPETVKTSKNHNFWPFGPLTKKKIGNESWDRDESTCYN